MYGMVNQGIRAFIVENFSEETWNDLCVKAGLKEREFESMLTYPDKITYDLVGAISDTFKMKPQDVLSKFGNYWVNYSSSSQIGQVLRFGGSSLIERLSTLDEMHQRVQMSMPHLKPPSFEFELGPDNVHKLHYASERENLEFMVIGLVHGLAKECGETIEITQDDHSAYDEFRATFTLTIL